MPLISRVVIRPPSSSITSPEATSSRACSATRSGFKLADALLKHARAQLPLS